MRSVIMEVPKQPCIIEVLMLASLSSRIAPSWFQQPLCIDLPTPIPAPNTSPEALPEKASIGSPREFGFGVLSAICKPELIDEVLAGCGRLERRCRLLPARLMVYALLLMCLRANLSYDKLMHHLAGAAGTPGSWSPPHKSAFFRARMRLGSEVMEHLFRALARSSGRSRALTVSKTNLYDGRWRQPAAVLYSGCLWWWLCAHTA
jgi:hypothetical protein